MGIPGAQVFWIRDTVEKAGDRDDGERGQRGSLPFDFANELTCPLPQEGRAYPVSQDVLPPP